MADFSFCNAPLPLEWLIDYGLGELAPPDEELMEQHLFECASCAARLELLERLRSKVAELVAGGLASAAVTGHVLERFAESGPPVRQYRIPPGGKVECTAAPEDAYVAIRLAADFQDFSDIRMNVDFLDIDSGNRSRSTVEDVPVDRNLNEIVLLFPGSVVRGYPRSLWKLEIHGRRERQEVPLGVFELDHTPWERLTG
jgi:hypothetical protein